MTMHTRTANASSIPPRFVQSPAGMRLAVHSWGPAPSAATPREVVVLLHGFPDRAQFWSQVAQHLQRDCHVIAYDMRGCGQSTPIEGRRHYRYSELIDDLFAVIQATSPHQKVHLVGHDWGALYGWDAVLDARASAHIASFVTMAPSLNQIGLWMRQRLLRPSPRNLAQALHQGMVSNGLMLSFTLPLVPELVWRSGAGRWLMRQMLQRLEGLKGDRAEPPPGTEADAVRFLGIYRANLLQQVLRPQTPRRTPVPVHALIALRDPFLPPRVFEGCAAWATAYTQSTVDAAHWAPLSQAQQVAHTVQAMARRWAVAHARPVTPATPGPHVPQPTPTH